MLDDRNFMGVMSDLFSKIFDAFDYDLNFPQPIGSTDMEDIILFFACCYLVAEMIMMVGSRRD